MKRREKIEQFQRRLAHEADLADLRDGRKLRAATFVDRKKQASKDACRNRKEQEC